LGEVFHFARLHAPHGGKVCPLVGEGNEGLIHKYTVARLARPALQGKGDEAAEPPFGKSVLVREESIVGVEAHFGPGLHGFREQKRAHPARRPGVHGRGEEYPDVAAVPGTRTLQGGRDAEDRASLQERRRVLPPAALVEVDGKEPAGLARKQRIDSYGEVPLRSSLPLASEEVILQHLVGDGKKFAVRALAASHAGFSAPGLDPFIAACRKIPRLAGLAAFESPGIDVLPAPEKAPEKSDLLFRRRPFGDLRRRLGPRNVMRRHIRRSVRPCSFHGRGTRQRRQPYRAVR